MSFGLEQAGGSLIIPMALAHPLHPINDRSRNKRWNLWVGWCVSSWWPMFSSRISVSLYIYLYVCILYTGSGYRMYIYTHSECHSVLVKLHPITVYRAVFWEHAVPLLNATCCFLWFQPFVSYSMVIRLILGCLWPLVSVLNYILTLGILRSVIFHLPGCFLSLDLLPEYRIQHTVGTPCNTAPYITGSNIFVKQIVDPVREIGSRACYFHVKKCPQEEHSW